MARLRLIAIVVLLGNSILTHPIVPGHPPQFGIGKGSYMLGFRSPQPSWASWQIGQELQADLFLLLAVLLLLTPPPSVPAPVPGKEEE